jgi:malonate transporter and related proteins
LILDLLVVVLPVFLVIGAGYAATRTGLFRPSAVDGLMVFTQNFAVPCLLFRGVATLDLGAVFDPRLLVSFYTGAVACFVLGTLGARRLFGRRPGEAVAIGFGALFSNSVLLGLPIIERAYSDGVLAPTFAIIAIHAPFCYLVGITAMEFARADGRSLAGTARAVGNAMFRNALMIGIALGFVVNLLDIALPEPVWGAVNMMAAAALPAALFGLGGVLTRYALRASLAEASMIASLSLLVHPAIALALAAGVFALPPDFVRAAVVTASMAPGVNAYVFASLYSRGQAQAASVVLLATAICVVTVSGWLALLARLY